VGCLGSSLPPPAAAALCCCCSLFHSQIASRCPLGGGPGGWVGRLAWGGGGSRLIRPLAIRMSVGQPCGPVIKPPASPTLAGRVFMDSQSCLIFL
jgi:hypothetical protein